MSDVQIIFCKCGKSRTEHTAMGCSRLEVAGYNTIQVDRGIYCHECGALLLDPVFCEQEIAYIEKDTKPEGGPF